MRRVDRAAALVFLVAVALSCKKKEEPVAVQVSTPVAVPSVQPEATAAAPSASESAATTAASASAGAAPSAATTAAQKLTTPDAGAAPKGDEAGYKALMACCGALNAEVKKASQYKNKYTAAAAACIGIAQSVKKGAANAASAKTTIHAQLVGAPVPHGC